MPPSSSKVKEASKPSCTSKKCVVSCMHRRVPISRWLPRYRSADIVGDLVAGVTVGLTLIPQSIAYASLAGLDPQYGLYSAFLGSFVYIIFGTVKEVNLGPSALLSLLTFNYTHGLNAHFAVLLCFLAGCVQLVCGLLHLGFMVEFISTPVVSGFTSAAALMIASSQIKGLLGLKFHAEVTFLHTWFAIWEHIGQIRIWDAVLGGTCCFVLLSLKLLKDNVKIGGGGDKMKLTKKEAFLSNLIWFISTSRNAMVVLSCAGFAYYLKTKNHEYFMLTGRVKSGLPPLRVPHFHTHVHNQTYTFVEMCEELGSGIIVTPVVAIIGNVAIGKAFASGRILDATQEMMTLGLCNIAGSFVGSMPVTGSFSRSAVSNASGVRSPLAGLYTGVMVLLSLSLLTPYFYFIPRATLSAVIMCAVIFMVDTAILGPMWRTNKKDLLASVITFVSCLAIGMEKGIILGVAMDVIFLLYANARPKVKVEIVSNVLGPSYVLATPSMGLLFPAVDHVRSEVQGAGEPEEGQEGLPLVLDCRNLQRTDFTAAQGLQSLILDFKAREQLIIFHNIKPSVLRVLTQICTQDFLHSGSDAELASLLKGLKNANNSRDATVLVEE